MKENLSKFLVFYETVHKNSANRYVHHVAHLVAVIGILLFWRPMLFLVLIVASFALSWLGHYCFERNTPAFFDKSEAHGIWASACKKLQVALGGIFWTFACFLRLFNLGPLFRYQELP